MIGLRRAAPDRQGDPSPRTAKGQERRPLQCEIQKLLHPALLAVDRRKVCLLNFLPGVMVVRYHQYLPSVDTLMRDVLPIRCANATKTAQ
jgi:hypothetical protein